MCNIYRKKASKTEQYTYLKRRKCCANKKLRDLCDIFFARLFVYHLYATFNVCFFFLCDMFWPEALRKKREKNWRNVKVIVNSFWPMSINININKLWEFSSNLHSKIHLKFIINMSVVISTLRKMILFGWSKTEEKGYMKIKTHEKW